MLPLQKSLLIGAGAFIGANLRYWFGELVGSRAASGFPIATFLVNIMGALAIGTFFALELRYSAHASLRHFIAVGLLGGFTTFSAFSWESYRLIERGELLTAVLYAIASVALTIAACAIGFAATRFALGG
jgi:CrcB protein